MAVCEGTVRAGNKRYIGDLDLDLDPGESSLPVRVYYIPLSARMEGSRFDGRRVQFHLGFTLDKGYEAYKCSVQCASCRLKVEMTWDQQEVAPRP